MSCMYMCILCALQPPGIELGPVRREGKGREGEGKGRGGDVACLWITIIHCWCWPLINSSDCEEKCNQKLPSNCYCHQTSGQFNGTL